MKLQKVLFLLAVLVVTSTNVACEAQPQQKEKKSLNTTKEKVSYTIGVDIGQNFKANDIDVDFDALLQGMRNAINGDSLLLNDEQRQQTMMEFQEEMQKKQQEKAEKAGQTNAQESAAFLEANKKREGVTTLPSGVQYEVIKMGDGPKPTEKNEVEVHYHGTLPDGTVFDSSVDRGQTISFPVTGVIAGWTEILQLMPVGSKWKVYIPADKAYGERGAGAAIGPNQALIFEIELFGIK